MPGYVLGAVDPGECRGKGREGSSLAADMEWEWDVAEGVALGEGMRWGKIEELASQAVSIGKSQRISGSVSSAGLLGRRQGKQEIG